MATSGLWESDDDKCSEKVSEKSGDEINSDQEQVICFQLIFIGSTLCCRDATANPHSKLQNAPAKNYMYFALEPVFKSSKCKNKVSLIIICDVFIICCHQATTESSAVRPSAACAAATHELEAHRQGVQVMVA